MNRALESRIRKAKVHPNAGCGTAPVFRNLHGVFSVGADFDESFVSKSNRFFNSAVVAKVPHLPFKSGSISCVAMFDVLEHLRDDDASVREARRALAPNGRMFVAVPAFQQLWSKPDESVGHFQMYNSSSLGRPLKKRGLVVDRMTSFNSIPFLPIAAMNVTGAIKFGAKESTAAHKLVEVSVFNPVLTFVFRTEECFAPSISLGIGVSLFCIARNLRAR